MGGFGEGQNEGITLKYAAGLTKALGVRSPSPQLLTLWLTKLVRVAGTLPPSYPHWGLLGLTKLCQ